MQIAITLRNNHHAKRVSRLFIYRGAGSVRATFSFPDPRNSILWIRSLIIFAENARRMLRAFQFITLYCVDPAFTFNAKGYVGFTFSEKFAWVKSQRRSFRGTLKKSFYFFLLKYADWHFKNQDYTWITDVCYRLLKKNWRLRKNMKHVQNSAKFTTLEKLLDKLSPRFYLISRLVFIKLRGFFS